jgi:signal peptidase II
MTTKMNNTFCRLVGLSWFKWVPLVFLSDQLSKWWVLTHLTPYDSLSVMPGVKFLLAQNRGVAFSLFDKQDGTTSTLLIVFIAAVALTIMVWLARSPKTDRWSGWALVAILGGALGNLCDRIWHGYVVDFIDLSVGPWHWYTFNIADSFITVGAIVLMIILLFSPENAKGAVCPKP